MTEMEKPRRQPRLSGRVLDMTILAFRQTERSAFAREISREAEMGLQEIIEFTRSSLLRIKVGSPDPTSEIEKLGTELLFQWQEVGLLLSDLKEMRSLLDSRGRTS